MLPHVAQHFPVCAFLQHKVRAVSSSWLPVEHRYQASASSDGVIHGQYLHELKSSSRSVRNAGKSPAAIAPGQKTSSV